MRLPLDRCRCFFDELRLRAPLDDATELLLAEVRTRLGYLVLGFRRFGLRGVEKVRGEWHLACLALNIKRMRELAAC